MTAILLLVALLTPLAGLALLALPGPSRRAGMTLAPWAAVPALLLAISGPDHVHIELPWLLLGTQLGLDPTRRIFLLLTAGAWSAAGLFARSYHADDPRRLRLFAFHLATLLGNLGLVFAADVASFYLFFVLMNLAAFGLIVHAGTDRAMRAGLVYLVLVVIGEALILPGLWLAVAGATSLALPDIADAVAAGGALPIALLALGFGIKAGALPLHVWLPLAHPAAPTPSSAVLSGAMIKGGLLAWLSLLPIGLDAAPGFAALFLGAGLTAAFYGAAVGVLQVDPKTVLAYSSISQMGLITVAVGIALTGPDAGAAGLLAALAYALHHALAKSALFLGVGVVDYAGAERRRFAALVLLALPALALAGAPLTSGVLAKTALKEAADGLSPAWQAPLDLLLSLAAVGTTLLMVRFLWVLQARETEPGEKKLGLWPPWLLLIGAMAVTLWLPILVPAELRAKALDLSAVIDGLWPIALGLILAAGAAWWTRRLRVWPDVPEGDLLWPAMAVGLWMWDTGCRGWHGLTAMVSLIRPPSLPDAAALDPALDRIEQTLGRWPIVVGGLLALSALCAALLARG